MAGICLIELSVSLTRGQTNVILVASEFCQWIKLKFLIIKY